MLFKRDLRLELSDSTESLNFHGTPDITRMGRLLRKAKGVKVQSQTRAAGAGQLAPPPNTAFPSDFLFDETINVLIVYVPEVPSVSS